MWRIWKERNDKIFRDKKSTPLLIGSKIINNIIENTKVAVELKPKILEGIYDKEILQNWDFTSKYKAPISPRESAVWNSPPPGWLKVNFDGAAKGNPGIAGCGCIARNTEGKCIAASAVPIGSQTSHMAKEMAALHACKLAKRKNCSKLWLEGDSLNTINCINGINSPSWNTSHIFDEIKILIDGFDVTYASHAFKESNCVANSLANVGAFSDDVKY